MNSGGVRGKKQVGSCTEPEYIFASGKLAEIDGDLVQGLERVIVPRSRRPDDGDGFMDGGKQKRVVRGEVLEEQVELAAADVNGERVLRLCCIN
jgi:hypothetical protein